MASELQPENNPFVTSPQGDLLPALVETQVDDDDMPSLAPLSPNVGVLLSVVPKTTDSLPPPSAQPKKRRKSKSTDVAPKSATSASAPATTTSTPITRRSQDLRSSGSRDRANVSVFVSQNFILLKDNLGEYEPLVIEKKNGHPGSFIPFKKDEHLYDTQSIDCHAIVGIITTDPTESYLILINGVEEVGEIFGDFIYKITKVIFVSFKKDVASASSVFAAAAKSSEKNYFGVEKFITSGLFYFSYTFHLTHSLQRISTMDATKALWKVADRRFFWNRYLQRHFIKKQVSAWVVPIIRGYVGISKGHVLPGTTTSADVILISRNSCMRAGTRYNARGINDDGNVANFVETEQILVVDGNVISFLQTRGSVPVFWQQRANNVGQFFVELTRTTEATTPAFRKHMEDLLNRYKKVHVVNLLAPRKKEGEVADAYREQVHRFQADKSTPKFSVNYTHWDFNAECGQKNFHNIVRLLPIVQDSIENYKFFLKSKENQILQYQIGSFRVNCLDCLDRTNVIMGAIAMWSLPHQLQALGHDNVIINDTSVLGQSLNELWATNGDNLSRAYAGTGALKSGFTRHGKRTVVGMMEDMVNSAYRVYVNNFKDGSKQEAIDQFLGNIEEEIAEEDIAPEDLWVIKQLQTRQAEFTEYQKTRMYMGTWNVNGTPPSTAMFLDPWISPEYPNIRDVDHENIMIYIFGFQEIVELTTSSIIDADESNMKNWAALLRDAINIKRKKSQVSLAHCVQLVGLAILVFVQSDHIGSVRNFTIEKTKTGGQGFAGNKGALVARFDFRDTPICCVVAHLTAGQTKYQDRLDDIRSINELTQFSVRRTPKIEDHDYVFWFGDFNFRIDLPYEEVHARIETGDLDVLLQFDQLNKSKKANLVFQNYGEGPIAFLPTYKYDLGNDIYDSSDKNRAPAWTDRILFRSTHGLRIQQLVYSRGELYHSDHRPVKTLFDLDIKIVNSEKRSKVEKELYKVVNTMDKDALLKAVAPSENLLGDIVTTNTSIPPPSPSHSHSHSASVPPSPSPSGSVAVTGMLIDFGPVTTTTTATTATITTTSTSSSTTTTPTPTPTPQPVPLTRMTKTQEVFIAYKNSLVAIKSKIPEYSGNTEMIKSVANLVISVVKTVMILLSYFERNEKAAKLLQVFLLFSVDFAVVSQKAASKADEKTLTEFSESVGKFITAFEDHLEFLI